jgi:hypothetical protein
MLLEVLSDLIDFNPNSKVYVHNFANFDYLLLIKVLFDNFIVKPYFKDSKMINLVYYKKGKEKIKISFFDSYQILLEIDKTEWESNPSTN